jgi:hypothetical protein
VFSYTAAANIYVGSADAELEEFMASGDESDGGSDTESVTSSMSTFLTIFWF